MVVSAALIGLLVHASSEAQQLIKVRVSTIPIIDTAPLAEPAA